MQHVLSQQIPKHTLLQPLVHIYAINQIILILVAAGLATLVIVKLQLKIVN